MAVSAEHVLYLAAGIFGAAPTRTLTYDLMTRKDTVALANELGVSQYAKDVFGVSNQAKAEKLADNLLGTSVTDTVKTAAIGALKGMLDANGGNVGAAGYEAIVFLSKKSDASYADAWTQLQNRVAVAQAYVDSANPATTFPLTSVTKDTATKDAVIAAIKSGADTAPLTVNTDTLAANKFSAGLDYTPGGNDRVNTLQDEDTLVGTGVNPTMNATLGNSNDNGATTITPKMQGIDTINVAFSGSGGTAVNQLDLQDSTNSGKIINITRVNDGVATATIDNISVASTELSVANSGQGGQSISFAFKDAALSGATDSTKLTVNDVQVANLSVQSRAPTAGVGFETINLVSSTNTNSIGVFNAEDLETLNISGDAKLTLGTKTNVLNAGIVEAQAFGAGLGNVQGSLKAVSAATLTADLDITFTGEFNAGVDGTSGQNTVLSVTGGKGNDTIRLSNDTIGTTDVIDGGEGTNTLVVTNNAVVNAAGTAAAPVATVKNVQALEVRTGHDNNATADTVTVNADAFDKLATIFVRNEGQNTAASVAESMTATLNNLTAAQAAAITVAHGTTGNNGFANNTVNANLKTTAGTSDTVAVTLVDGVNSDLRFNMTLATARSTGDTTGVENITITDKDTESNTVILANVADHKGTITLSGGLAGTFFNLDTTTAGVNGGLYGYDLTGATADITNTVADLSGTANQTLLAAATINASAQASNVVVRVSTNAASATGAQNITMGTGNDTVIFDNVNDLTAGLTITDTVTAGTGTDVLVIDGNNAAGIALSASEFQNVTGFETLRFVGNAARADDNSRAGTNSYKLSLSDAAITNNANGGNVWNVVNDNGAAGVYTTATSAAIAANSGITIDLRALSSGKSINYDGQETSIGTVTQNATTGAQTFTAYAAGAGQSVRNSAMTADRFIFADAGLNATAIIDGGADQTTGVGGAGAGARIGHLANNDVLEVRNAAVVSYGDLANITNVGRIEFTNDTATVQTSTLQLNNAVVDAMVNNTLAALGTDTTTIANTFEVLTVAAVDGAAASTRLNMDAAQVTNAALRLDITGGGDNDTIIAGAGNDTIVAGAGNDSIVAGAGDDSITGGTGADVINVGTGTDRVVIAAGDISATNGAAAAATFAAVGDVILGMTNGNGAGTDTLDLDITGFTGGNLAGLTIAAAADLTAAGAINTAAANVLVHNAAVGIAGTNAVVNGVVQSAFVTAALAVITTAAAATNSATTSDGYIVIRDQAGDGTADLAIFKVDHAAGTAITAAEVTFVGVLADFGATLTNGFIV